MQIVKISTFFLLLLFFSACEIETEELVDVSQPEQTEHDKRIDAEAEKENLGKELTQEEIDDLEFEDELNKVMEEAQLEEDVNLANEMMDLDEKKKTGEVARGSCDAIAEASTCLEYYGSFWTETQMKYNCSDSGIFSTKPCVDGYLGGCNVGKGGANDMVTWFYNIGGSPMGDSIQYAEKACNMTLMSSWISAK